MLETIAYLDDPSIARVLAAALSAHGFHPVEGGNDGLPGMPGVMGLRGIPLSVPEEEAADARLLADALIAEMRARP